MSEKNNSNLFDLMPEEYEKGMFIEIAGTIHKKSLVPTSDGKTVESWIPWSMASIMRRYGRDKTRQIVEEMPIFDGIRIVPEHINYRPVIGRYLNGYQPLAYKPMAGANWNHIGALLRHIFGEQYELGLDYIQLLYVQPKQKLPVILLVSQETRTGKSTFCRLLKEIFGANATELTNSMMRSNFNSSWAGKLLVYIEETLLDRREDGEVIKNLVTADRMPMEAKGKDAVEAELFAKFVMCSNDEERPILLTSEDSRFWVRKVPPIAEKKPGENFFDEMKKEIPYFLYFLLHRQLSTANEDRLWFRRDLIVTEAWKKIVNHSRSQLEQQVVELLIHIMKEKGLKEVDYTVKDIVRLLRYEDYRANRAAVKKLLTDRWHLTCKKQRYDLWVPTTTLSGDEDYVSRSTTGWAYNITLVYLDSLTD